MAMEQWTTFLRFYFEELVASSSRAFSHLAIPLLMVCVFVCLPIICLNLIVGMIFSWDSKPILYKLFYSDEWCVQSKSARLSWFDIFIYHWQNGRYFDVNAGVDSFISIYGSLMRNKSAMRRCLLGLSRNLNESALTYNHGYAGFMMGLLGSRIHWPIKAMKDINKAGKDDRLVALKIDGEYYLSSSNPALCGSPGRGVVPLSSRNDFAQTSALGMYESSRGQHQERSEGIEQPNAAPVFLTNLPSPLGGRASSLDSIYLTNTMVIR